jgi:hypothetical protein
MSDSKTPPRSAEERKRVRLPDLGGVKPAAGAPTNADKTSGRHAAITNNLGDWSSYKSWVKKIHDTWIESKQDMSGASMGLAAKHIHQALHSKLERDGSLSLTWAESRLLRASRFLLAVESDTLPKLLADLSPSELFEIFDALSAIGATSTANLWLETLHRLAPFFGVEKAVRDVNAIAAIALDLASACRPGREADEICLLKFAFEHSESSGPTPPPLPIAVEAIEGVHGVTSR